MEAKKIPPPVVDPTQRVDYQSTLVPTNYVCHKCEITGVKLWREYHAHLKDQSLLCSKCSGEEQRKDVSSITNEGKINNSDQIGCRVPAVPTKENDTYWGYSFIPEEGQKWWKRLPNLL